MAMDIDISFCKISYKREIIEKKNLNRKIKIEQSQKNEKLNNHHRPTASKYTNPRTAWRVAVGEFDVLYTARNYQ